MYPVLVIVSMFQWALFVSALTVSLHAQAVKVKSLGKYHFGLSSTCSKATANLATRKRGVVKKTPCFSLFSSS